MPGSGKYPGTTSEKTVGEYPREKLFFGLVGFVFCKDRRYGLGGYGPAHQRCELVAVMDMRYLETDNEPETEAGYADQCVTRNIYHIFPLL